MGGAVVIDGAAGGGQMLRNAVALSAVSGRAVRVVNIRGARPQPGLRPQHLAAVRAAAGVCGARLIGAEVGSREIEFRPGEVRGGADWRIDVGTAGSLTLVLQCLVPPLARANDPSSIGLVGGTDVPFAPPFDYFANVLVPALGEMGVHVEAALGRRGFYPKGGGEIGVRVGGSSRNHPVHWTERGEVRLVRGRCFGMGLPAHVGERMRSSALGTLSGRVSGNVEIELEVAPRGRSEGCGIVLWAECEGGQRLGASALGRRGKRAEEVGEEAAKALVSELEAGGAVDSHLADQIVVWLATADGPSEFTAARVTDHLRFAVEVAEAVVGARFSLHEGRPARVRCEAPAHGRSGEE